MAILSVNTESAGEAGVLPRIIRIVATDSFATIAAANYLAPLISQGYAISHGDIVAITYGTTPTTQLFTVDISGNTITLAPTSSEVVLPVVDGNFAVFEGTSGAIDDAGYSPSDAAKTKIVMATAATTVGRLAQFNDVTGTIGDSPIDASTVVTAAAATTIGRLAQFNSVAGGIEDSPINANQVLTSAITTPDVNANLVAFDVTVTAATLAGAAAVTLYTSAAGKQYKIRQLWLNSGGTNFSGGGGDRLLDITDGTTVYARIAAADLQALPGNVSWGAATLPFPAAAALNTSTVAAENLRAVYSGGAADYAAGSVVISGLLQRVA